MAFMPFEGGEPIPGYTLLNRLGTGGVGEVVTVTATGGVTPIYASPEAFDGRISRFSDQYSLAIVYQEMLTGVRPFPGTTAYQLAAQHTTSPPMLDALPAQDRGVIGRALAKTPEERFSCCREMVDELLLGLSTPAAAAAPAEV